MEGGAERPLPQFLCCSHQRRRLWRRTLTQHAPLHTKTGEVWPITSELHAHLFFTLLQHCSLTRTHSHTRTFLLPSLFHPLLRLTHKLVGGLLNSLLWQRIPVALSCSSDVCYSRISLSPQHPPSCSSCLHSCSHASHSVLLMKNWERVGCKDK